MKSTSDWSDSVFEEFLKLLCGVLAAVTYFHVLYLIILSSY